VRLVKARHRASVQPFPRARAFLHEFFRKLRDCHDARVGEDRRVEDAPSMGLFGVYRERVAAGLAEGLTIEQLDEQVLRDAPLDEDEKAALWLFGYSLADLRRDDEGIPAAR
jgi:hypothetical protein